MQTRGGKSKTHDYGRKLFMVFMSLKFVIMDLLGLFYRLFKSPFRSKTVGEISFYFFYNFHRYSSR